MFVFDLLADGTGDLAGEPLSKRRAKLERFAEDHLDDNGTLRISPATNDITVARKRLSLVGGSLDGVVAKRLHLPYQPGISRGMQKIKRLRTVDCVVGGVIVKDDAVSHLLLGLYDEAGLLNFIGSAPLKAAAGKKLAGQIAKLIEPPGFTGKRPGEVRTQFGHRMGEWQPLKSVLVTEVQYDHFTGGRFRHGAKVVRCRLDKKPESWSTFQVG